MSKFVGCMSLHNVNALRNDILIEYCLPGNARGRLVLDCVAAQLGEASAVDMLFAPIPLPFTGIAPKLPFCINTVNLLMCFHLVHNTASYLLPPHGAIQLAPHMMANGGPSYWLHPLLQYEFSLPPFLFHNNNQRPNFLYFNRLGVPRRSYRLKFHCQFQTAIKM